MAPATVEPYRSLKGAQTEATLPGVLALAKREPSALLLAAQLAAVLAEATFRMPPSTPHSRGTACRRLTVR